MKQVLLLIIILSCYNSYAQNSADLIIGKWMKTPNEDMTIEVFRSNDEYRGKLSWAKDMTNSKPLGFIVLEGLKYNEKTKTWINGKIHSPHSGNSYSATAKIKPDGTLEVLGYKGGMKFLGRKKYFKRVP